MSYFDIDVLRFSLLIHIEGMMSRCLLETGNVPYAASMAPAAYVSRKDGNFDPRCGSLEIPTRFNCQFYLSAFAYVLNFHVSHVNDVYAQHSRPI